MQRYTVYLYLETALHVSGGTTTHHQERKQLYLQHLVFVTPLLLPAAIVEDLELHFLDGFFQKSENINFYENRLLGAELFHSDGRTDAQT